MAKGLFKYMDVDVIAFLEKEMKSNTKHYQSDFEIDKQKIESCCKSAHQEDKTLLWMSRPNGTHCQREREAFIRDTYDHQTWRFYAEQTSDIIIAFAVELTGMKDGVIRGNVYELDYPEHAAMVGKRAIPPYEAIRSFEDGYIDRVPMVKSSYSYYAALVEKHGRIVDSRTISQSDEVLDITLSEQKAMRRKIRVADHERVPQKPALADHIADADAYKGEIQQNGQKERVAALQR